MHPTPPFSSQNIQLENTCWTKTAMAQATVWRIKNGALLAMQTQRLHTVSKWTPRKIGGTIMKVLHAGPGIIMASRIIPSLTLPVLLRMWHRCGAVPLAALWSESWSSALCQCHCTVVFWSTTVKLLVQLASCWAQWLSGLLDPLLRSNCLVRSIRGWSVRRSLRPRIHTMWTALQGQYLHRFTNLRLCDDLRLGSLQPGHCGGDPGLLRLLHRLLHPEDRCAHYCASCILANSWRQSEVEWQLHVAAAWCLSSAFSCRRLGSADFWGPVLGHHRCHILKPPPTGFLPFIFKLNRQKICQMHPNAP